ncbi:MAG: dihydrolipoamide acetyltransferase family protein [Dehalococcoidia bacterium]|nr:dihydrolipoamide acetyltransferase family protein [Dehalococcoidia bacterium]
MAFTLTMPEVGETVTEGTIEKWLKQPGEHVDKYEPIVEINTDKVNVELPCPVTGTLREILAPEGATVLVGGELAVIEEVAGETPAEVAPPVPSAGEAPAPRQPAAPPAGREADAAGEPRRATPRVRRLAAEMGVDLVQVTGSGAGGRIIEDDVRAAAGRKAAAAPQAPARSAPAAAPGGEEQAVPLTAVRRTIAQRMAASAFTAPHAWLVVEADVTGLVALRQAQKEAFRGRHGVDLTYLPFAAHAVARSLLDHPYLNASWAEDKIILKKRVHLGIAAATERGLVVPVVKDADRLSVTALAAAIADLGERARTNRLTLEDVRGGTFTLDNTGAFGSIVSMPIINLGQAAIISLEAITKQPRVVPDNAIAVRSVVNLCLSFDHRILDGHQAGAFLADVKKRLEDFGPASGLD